MKFLIVVAFVAAAVASVNAASLLNEEQKAQAKKYVDQCMEEIKITDDEFAKLRAAELDNASQDVKCFANCFLEKVGVVKDGALQEAFTLEKFSPIVGEEKSKEILAACAGEKGADKCETAYKLHTCFVKNKAGLE